MEKKYYRVVDTPKTLSGLPITISDGVGVNVVVAVALLAGANRSELSHRISEVSVLTKLTARSGSSGRTLDTDRRIRISGDFETSSSVRTRTTLAVVGGSDEGVSVEAFGAALAVVAVGVVEARTFAFPKLEFFFINV